MLDLDINNSKKYYGDRPILDIKDLEIYREDRIGVVGLNGSGKTTLLNMILNRGKGIKISRKAKMGYFNQDLSILNENKSIIENMIESNIYDETTVRIILARLLFKREDVYKKVKMLSGGERIKVSLAKILTSDFNILILDEPTNYLDIYSIEAVEEGFSRLKELENRKKKPNKDMEEKHILGRKVMLGYKLSEILGKLSLPGKDDDMGALDR